MLSKDIARCEPCNETFALSRLAADLGAVEVDLSHPPRGAWFERTLNGFYLGATTRSASAWALIPFACFWSAATLAIVLSGDYSTFRFLAAIPFVLASFLLWGAAAMSVFGRCTLVVRNDEAELFTGVRSLGRRHRFPWSDVYKVTEREVRTNHPRNILLLLMTRKGPLWVFARGVGDKRRIFLHRAIERMIAERRIGEKAESGALTFASTHEDAGALSEATTHRRV